MTGAEIYPMVKHAHVGLALATGGLFALRGIAVLSGSGLGMAAPVRYASYAIDTLLLAAAVALLFLLGLNPVTTPWLAVKLAFLVAYIVLGSLALKRASTGARKALAFAGAALCYLAMYAVARSHDALGFIPGSIG